MDYKKKKNRARKTGTEKKKMTFEFKKKIPWKKYSWQSIKVMLGEMMTVNHYHKI